MNSEALKKHLAIEVMGWKVTGTEGKVTLEFTPKVLPTYYDPKTCEAKGFVKDYKPDENIEQAMECLKTFPTWSMSFDLGIYEVCINWRKDTGINDILEMAISLACAKTTGWKE